MERIPIDPNSRRERGQQPHRPIPRWMRRILLPLMLVAGLLLAEEGVRIEAKRIINGQFGQTRPELQELYPPYLPVEDSMLIATGVAGVIAVTTSISILRRKNPA